MKREVKALLNSSIDINSHLKLPPFSHLILTPSKKRYRSSIMDFMMEEKGDAFYGGVGNYQVFKGKGLKKMVKET